MLLLRVDNYNQRGEDVSGKDNRIKKNLLSSLVYQIVLISLSFLLPRLYLENFGSEVNGVLSTIKDIFKYMCLLEAGVGLATTQALYKRIGENDYKAASSVLAATHTYYVKTGFIYFGIVMLIAIVYGYVIPTGINPHVVFVMVLLNAVPSLFSYFIQAKYRILMEVDGRKYVINNSETVVQLLANAGKVLVLFLTDSLVLIQLVYCVIALTQMVYLYVYAKRRYTWLNLKTEPDMAAISQKNSVFVHQISGMVFNNTDIMLISALCGFKAASIYTIYNTFFAQMQTFITNLASGFTFALGQMFNIEREKFDRVYSIYEPLYIMITFVIYTLMAVFLLPLIQIYTSGINDANYTNLTLVFLFVVMNLISNAKLPANGIIEYSGCFEKTRHQAVLEMVINITVSVVSIIYFGICGAIFGTVAALVYRSIAVIHYSNRVVLGRSVWATYKSWVINGGVFAVIMVIFYVDTFSNMSFLRLLLNGMLHSVWIVALYVAANLIFDRKVFTTLLEIYREKKNNECS